MSGGGPLSLDDQAGIALLRARLRAANFTPDGVRAALGTETPMLAREADVPVHLRRLSRATPLATIIKLFILAAPVSDAEAEGAFAPVALARLRAMGVLTADGGDGRVRAWIRIVPHDELLVASDPGFYLHGDAPAAHVPGVQRPSLTLAHLTVRLPVAAGLDLGTGCGIQALLLSRHCARVVATDISERALDYAAFNALLNGVRNVEFRRGSWFEPVSGERFEVIATNPPYVISPDSRFVFRDSGLSGDSASEQVVRAMPAYLTEGGFGVANVSWMHRSDEEPTTPLRRWLEGSGCDGWLLHYSSETPLTAAARWNESTADDPAEYGEIIDRWLDYYSRLGAQSIAYGSVLLRRRAAPRNWVRADPLPAGNRLRPASDHIRRVFAAQDHLSGLSNERDLLDERFALAGSHRVTETVQYVDGARRVEQIVLHLEEGLGFQATLDGPTADLLSRLGTGPLREALSGLAVSRGIPESARDDFVDAGVGAVRRLYELGFMGRAGPGG